MKEKFELEIFSALHALNRNQQASFRKLMKREIKHNGILSICLESEFVFIECRSDILDRNSIMDLLLEIKFPIKENLIPQLKDLEAA